MFFRQLISSERGATRTGERGGARLTANRGIWPSGSMSITDWLSASTDVFHHFALFLLYSLIGIISPLCPLSFSMLVFHISPPLLSQEQTPVIEPPSKPEVPVQETPMRSQSHNSLSRCRNRQRSLSLFVLHTHTHTWTHTWACLLQYCQHSMTPGRHPLTQYGHIS